MSSKRKTYLDFEALSEKLHIPEDLLREAQTMSRKGRPWYEVADLFGYEELDQVKRLLHWTGKAEAVESRRKYDADRIASEQATIAHIRQLQEAEAVRLRMKKRTS